MRTCHRLVVSLAFVAGLLSVGLTIASGQEAATRVRPPAVNVTILSTMLAGDRGRGIGEWGFAAILEVDGRRLLIDTGERPETVRQNADELGVDLSTVSDVVLTHNHGDHVGGLLALRRALSTRNPSALARAHVAPGIFLPRVGADGRPRNSLLAAKAEYEATGGTFVEHAEPAQLLPGVWFTGPVPRPNPERNWGGGSRLQTPDGPAEDTIPEDASVVIDTPAGLVVVTGCGHAGIVNILEHARTIRAEPVHAIVGGLHLYSASDETLAWTGAKLREFKVAHLLGAHCTGIEAVYRLREAIGLTRETAVVGAVGARFTLGTGIDPLGLAR
jgi:7,8-dihydropterin-6-yl-methyl-4-(beta-D-ribofuranosyl)aminobenzene 5'-phosphate synthase